MQVMVLEAVFVRHPSKDTVITNLLSLLCANSVRRRMTPRFVDYERLCGDIAYGSTFVCMRFM